MRINPTTTTWFAFPVTNEMEVHRDKGSGARWHVALDARGGVVVSDEWKVFYGTDYGYETPTRSRIGWDFVPPLYVQSVALRMVKEIDNA